MKRIMNREPIKMLVGIILTLVLAFPSQHIVAFAEVVSGQEEGGSANTSIPLDEDTSSENPSNEDTSGEGSVEGLGEESATDDASNEDSTETNEEEAVPADDSVTEPTTEDTTSDVAPTAKGESVSPLAVATVTTEAAFRTALADVTITEIYLGADISMSAGASATVANRTLVISGVDPADPAGTVHTYTDSPSITAGQGGLQGTCVDLTFRDINVSLSNYYGIYGTTAANKTVTFDNVTGTAPQFFHYYGSSAGSVFIVKDSNLTLGSGYLSVTGELAEADRVIFQGNTTVARTASTANNIFYLAGTYASVTVEDGANVTVDNSANGTAGGAIFYTTQAVNIGNNAIFNCYTGQGFMGSGSAAISIGQYSDVKFIYTGASARAAYYLQATSFSVDTQSNVLIYDNSSATNGALSVPGTVTLNNPQSFVVLNANRAAMAPGVATNLAGTQITSVRYFTGASQIAGVYDPVNREYIGTDASPFARWWIQNSSFSVSANNWPSSAPSGVTTSPLYSAANVPASAAGAETTLTSSNFGLNTSTAYGIAISGETNANITLEYYFDGVLDPARTTVITPSLLSTVNVSDVTLATTPVGYTLSGTPTSPTLPASAQSLDGQTVSVYYVTDPDQTATIGVNYYFDGVHNTSEDTTITPQILSTVNVSDVAFSTVPTGYMLDTTPTSPVLPASAQSLDGQTVNVYYVTDPSQTATINIQYYFDGTYDPSFDDTITPQILSVVSITDVALSPAPVGYTLDTPASSPELPATALSLDGTTVSVFYVTDSAQTASISINYYFNGVHDASMDATIMPQILSTVNVSDVALTTPPSGYMLSAIPTLPTLPASAQSLDGQTVNVYYVTDPGQTANINIQYFFDGTHDASFDTSIVRQALSSVTLVDVLLSTTPVGYRLASTPTSPTLPATALSLDGQTVSVFYVTDPTQTATIRLNYYFNGTHNASYDSAITPQILATVNVSDVTLSTVPVGYMLSSVPTLPTLPASAQSLNGTTVNVYYVTDPAQTATMNIEYYFEGVYDPSFDDSITRQALASVTLADVELTPVPVGYTLDTDPTNPILPQTAYTLDGTTISVFYVIDLGQTATIDVGYYFNGVLDASFSTTINPQILDTVTEADVVLTTTPAGYMLDAVPTSPVLPESAQTLNGTTINVYYVTDPSQTATINIQYYFDGVLDPARDTSITRQVLSAVGLADVTLASAPAGYTLAATPTSPVLPQSALDLDGTTVSVFYVTDAAQTATISVGYYFNGTLDASYSTTINPQLLATVNLSDVTLTTVPAGYMLSSTPTSPVLPQSAQSLDGTTINVFYVTDPSQTATITLNYYFNGTYDASFDATITPQILSSVSLSDVTLSPTPVGYMLDAIPTAPVLPASAQLLDNTTVNVYYVTNPNQTATIHIAYYLDGVLNPAYNATITPHILAQVNVSDVVLDTTPVGYMLDAVPTSPVLPESAQTLDGTTVNVYYVTDPSQTATVTLNYYFNGTYDASFDATITPQILSSVVVSDVTLSTVPTGYMLSSTPTSPTLPASAESLDGTTVNVYYVSDPTQTATITLNYYLNGVQDTSLDTTITPQILSTVTVEDVALATPPVGYMLAAIPTSPVLPASAQLLDGTTISIFYVTDPNQTATITLHYFFNGNHDPSYDTIITPQILTTVTLSEVVLAPAVLTLGSVAPAQLQLTSTPQTLGLGSISPAQVAIPTPAGYMLDTPPTSPALPASAESLDDTTLNVYYVTDPAQVATITLNYYFNGVHNASFDTTITPQVLEQVTLSDVVLSPTPSGYMLATPATSPSLPASALSLNNTTVNIYYVSIGERITANNFRYPIASGPLSAADAIAFAGVVAYDANGNLIPASSLTVNAAQLAAINAAIAAGDLSGNPFPLTFYTPDGTAITIEVTLFGEVPAVVVPPGEVPPSVEQVPTISAIAKAGDWFDMNFILVVGGTVSGMLLLALYKLRRARSRA